MDNETKSEVDLFLSKNLNQNSGEIEWFIYSIINNRKQYISLVDSRTLSLLEKQKSALENLTRNYQSRKTLISTFNLQDIIEDLYNHGIYYSCFNLLEFHFYDMDHALSNENKIILQRIYVNIMMILQVEKNIEEIIFETEQHSVNINETLEMIEKSLLHIDSNYLKGINYLEQDRFFRTKINFAKFIIQSDLSVKNNIMKFIIDEFVSNNGEFFFFQEILTLFDFYNFNGKDSNAETFEKLLNCKKHQSLFNLQIKRIIANKVFEDSEIEINFIIQIMKKLAKNIKYTKSLFKGYLNKFQKIMNKTTKHLYYFQKFSFLINKKYPDLPKFNDIINALFITEK